MAKPVMPDDEHFSYLPTQVIADYLANSRFRLDGIVYPSVQGKESQRNTVLFHEAAKVKEFSVVPGTEISVNASLDPDQDTSYWVFVSADDVAAKKDVKSKKLRIPARLDEQDYRDDTLEVLPDSVQVHHIRGVEFACEEFEVHRHTSTKQSLQNF